MYTYAAGLQAARDRQGLGARRADPAVRLGPDRRHRSACSTGASGGRSDAGRAAARRSCCSWRCCVFTAFNLTPIVWAVLTSIKLPVDAFAIPPKLIFKPTFEFHYAGLGREEVLAFLINSLIIVGRGRADLGADRHAWRPMRSRACAHAGTRARSCSACWPCGCSRTSCWRSRSSSWRSCLEPDRHLRRMVLALVAINQPFTIWLMRSFFVDVPIELDEAARIDGCNVWQMFSGGRPAGGPPGPVVTVAVQPAAGLQRVPVRPGPDRPAAPRPCRSRSPSMAPRTSTTGRSRPRLRSASCCRSSLFMMLVQRHLVRGLAFGAVKG